MSVTSTPLVSVCMPVYNAEATLDAALESVWSQSFDDVELVVVDDASTDQSPAILAEHRKHVGQRLRVLRNPVNLRSSGAANRAIRTARGRFLKFLDSDDLLDRNCLERLVALAVDRPLVNLVFCRRRLLLEDPEDPNSREWAERYASPHKRFGAVATISDGAELFSRWVNAGLQENWIGEPVTVLVRRKALERAGGFNRHLVQMHDRDLWLRVINTGEVGFADDELVTYRVPSGSSSLTIRNFRHRLDWLDDLWTFESLRANEEVWRREPRLCELRADARREMARKMRSTLRGEPEMRRARARDIASYVRWLLRRCVDRRAVPFERIGPPPPAEVFALR